MASLVGCGRGLPLPILLFDKNMNNTFIFILGAAAVRLKFCQAIVVLALSVGLFTGCRNTVARVVECATANQTANAIMEKRVPADWEPQGSVWMAQPNNDNKRDCGVKITFAELLKTLAAHTPANLCVTNAAQAQLVQRGLPRFSFQKSRLKKD